MVINFGAGPAKLPEEVLKEAQENTVNHYGTGISLMETSHRGPVYMSLNDEAINTLREIANVPDNYKILLMQGGGTGLFAAVCMNLMGRTGVADYIVTGTWSEKAAKEATKYGKVNEVYPKLDKYTTIPSPDTWKLDPNASYVYYCDNETVHGVEFNIIPDTKGVPIVADMSSNFLSRTIDISRYGLIFAGAQKNVGTSGITIVIVREDLIGNAMKMTPSVFNFAVIAKNNSIYNTPPTFVVYVMSLVFKWIKKNGGVPGMSANANKKSQLIYDVINKTNGFYSCPVDKHCRSRMNVPFQIKTAGDNDALETKFLNEAKALGMIQLKGHRSVGGIRASLYNAVTIKEAQTLADFMLEFYKNNS